MNNGFDAATLSPTSASFNQRLQLPASCDPPGPQNPAQQRVWVIFGATGHLGRSLVKAALSHGDLVTAVGRTFLDTIPSMQDLLPSMLLTPHQQQPQPTATATASHTRYLPLLCDVRIRDTVDAVFKTSLAHWSRIDIVANASGYGIIGACEDQDDFEIRDQFETNFWGTLHILQLSLPYFRSQAAASAVATDAGGGRGEGKVEAGGRYLIFSSTGGSLGVPGLGPFCATKYAVEGLIESMLYETAAFNIRATLVEPGHVRRDDPAPAPAATFQQQQQQRSKGKKSPATATATVEGANALPTFGHFFIKPASAAYERPTAPAGHAKRMLQWLGERQPTSAVKAAELVWQLGHCRFPPLRLLLGGFAVESVRDRLRSVTEEIEDWKFLSFKTEEDTKDGGEEGDEEDEDEEDEEEEAEEEEEGGEERERKGGVVGGKRGQGNEEETDVEEENGNENEIERANEGDAEARDFAETGQMDVDDDADADG